MWAHSILTSKSGEVIFLCSTSEDREVRRFVEFTQGSKQVHGWNWIPGLLAHFLETWWTCPCAWLIPVLVWTQRTEVSPSSEAQCGTSEGHLWLSGGLSTACPSRGRVGEKPQGTELCSDPWDIPPDTPSPGCGHLSTQRCSMIDFTAGWTVFQHILMETDQLFDSPGCAQA